MSFLSYRIVDSISRCGATVVWLDNKFWSQIRMLHCQALEIRRIIQLRTRIFVGNFAVFCLSHENRRTTSLSFRLLDTPRGPSYCSMWVCSLGEDEVQQFLRSQFIRMTTSTSRNYVPRATNDQFAVLLDSQGCWVELPRASYSIGFFFCKKSSSSLSAMSSANFAWLGNSISLKTAALTSDNTWSSSSSWEPISRSSR